VLYKVTTAIAAGENIPTESLAATSVVEMFRELANAISG
jgi:hypothetical protein